MEAKFDVNYVMKNLQQANEHLSRTKDVPFEPIQNILKELIKIFADLNSFLSVAFSDVSTKVEIINSNRSRFPTAQGALSFIREEIKIGVHKYNGKNNSKAPAEYKNYTSTARTLLRMMWLMTFLKVLFEESLNPKWDKLSLIMDYAYDAAFADNHGWLVRKSAKLAIMTSNNKQKLIEAVLGKNDEQLFNQYARELVQGLTPIWSSLWEFYKEHKLEKLE